MALTEAAAKARYSLELARIDEAHRIVDAVQTNQIVGVLGGAEVGKTETVRQALGPSTPDSAVITLDLDGTAGDEQVGFLLARQIASAFLGDAEFSTLKVGVLVPATIESKRLPLANLLGVDGLTEALRDWPSGTFGLTKALNALERLATDRHTVLWVDHLEAPALTPRHPLNVDQLLWALRELAQRLPRLTLVLSARDAFETLVLGREAAFYQQGRWLTLDNPTPEAWAKVAKDLRLSGRVAKELADLSGGHPETMLLALINLQRDQRSTGGRELLGDLALTATALTARAVQHARTLHRLGSQVLVQIALGQGPYAVSQRGESPPQEIRKVLGRLQLAGLIRHDDDGWSVVNPLIEIVLAERVRRTAVPDLDFDTTGDLRPEL